MSVPTWVTAACHAWVIARAHQAGELPLSRLEQNARVMRMTAAEIREARAGVQ